MCVPEILHMRVTDQEFNGSRKYGPYGVFFFFFLLMLSVTDLRESNPPRHVNNESLSSFAQPDAKHSAGNDPLTQKALGVSSRPGSSALMAQSQALRGSPRVEVARMGTFFTFDPHAGLTSVVKVSHHHHHHQPVRSQMEETRSCLVSKNRTLKTKARVRRFR